MRSEIEFGISLSREHHLHIYFKRTNLPVLQRTGRKRDPGNEVAHQFVSALFVSDYAMKGNVSPLERVDLATSLIRCSLTA